MKFDHIGIFVKDLKFGREWLCKLLPIKSLSEEISDINMGIFVQFLYDESGICYEIIAPNGDSNPVKGLLDKKVNILNHVAYRVENFKDAIIKYREIGCIPLSKASPAKAFNGKNVIFFLTRLGIIIELIES